MIKFVRTRYFAFIFCVLNLLACAPSRLSGAPVVATDAGAQVDTGSPPADAATIDTSVPPMDASAIDLGAGVDAGPGLDAGTDAGVPVVDSGGGGTFRSAGCGTTQATGLRTLTMTVRGEERSYLVSVPTGYDPNTPVPLHMNFHGCTGDSMSHWYSMNSRGGVEAAFGARGVYVYPQGLANSGCSTGWEMSNGGKDVEFVDSIRTTISDQFCIDTRGMIVTGMSYGGDFTNKYSCARPENVVIAVAQASSAWPHSDCAGPVPIVVTYALGDVYAETYTGPGFAISRDFWRVENGCTAMTDPETPSPCVRYRGCTENPLITCEVPGGDHGTFPDNLGVNLLRWYREQIGEIPRP